MAGHVPITDQTRSAGVPKRDISCLVLNTLNDEHYVQWEEHYAICTCILITAPTKALDSDSDAAGSRNFDQKQFHGSPQRNTGQTLSNIALRDTYNFCS